MKITVLPYSERKQLELLEQTQLELAAKAAGIAYFWPPLVARWSVLHHWQYSHRAPTCA